MCALAQPTQAAQERFATHWECLHRGACTRGACADALAQEGLHTGACIANALAYPPQAARERFATLEVWTYVAALIERTGSVDTTKLP